MPLMKEGNMVCLSVTVTMILKKVGPLKPFFSIITDYIPSI